MTITRTIGRITLTVSGALAKTLTLYPRQDVYVEKQRPTWSYRTSILQVGKTDSPDSEYRAFLAFDLSTVAASHARVVSAKLRLHPAQLGAVNADALATNTQLTIVVKLMF